VKVVGQSGVDWVKKMRKKAGERAVSLRGWMRRGLQHPHNSEFTSTKNL
jgi:hypothetical protein